MSAVDDVNELIEQFHLAQGELIKGNPEPVKKLTSHRDDVTLANPVANFGELRICVLRGIPLKPTSENPQNANFG